MSEMNSTIYFLENELEARIKDQERAKRERSNYPGGWDTSPEGRQALDARYAAQGRLNAARKDARRQREQAEHQANRISALEKEIQELKAAAKKGNHKK